MAKTLKKESSNQASSQVRKQNNNGSQRNAGSWSPLASNTAVSAKFKSAFDSTIKVLRAHPTATTIATVAVMFVGYTGYITSHIEDLIGKSHPVARPVPVAQAELKTLDAAKERSGNEQLKKAFEQLPGIDKVVELRSQKIRAIRDKNGKVMYLIDNGRFAFVGDLIDVWQKKKLETLEEVDWAFNRIDLRKFGFDLKSTVNVSYGSGAEHVTVFVDPTCPWCQKLVAEAKNDPTLLQKYTFDFVVVGFLGQRAKTSAKKFLCSNAPAEAKVNALAVGASAVDGLLNADRTCNEKPIQDTALVTNLMGITSVPYLIAPDGRFSKGKPASLKAWLESKPMPAADPDEKANKAPERPPLDIKPLKGVDMNTLNKVTIGGGKNHVTVFVDPQCGYCHKAIREIQNDKELLERYTFDIVFIGILGPESKRLNKLVACSDELPLKRLAAFNAGAEDIAALHQPDKCDGLKVVATEKLRKVMNIHSAPVFVTDDGRSTTGKPNSIRAFLGFDPAHEKDWARRQEKAKAVLQVKKDTNGKAVIKPVVSK